MDDLGSGSVLAAARDDSVYSLPIDVILTSTRCLRFLGLPFFRLILFLLTRSLLDCGFLASLSSCIYSHFL